MRTGTVKRFVGMSFGLAATITLVSCGPTGEEMDELRNQQRQILAKLGDLEKKIERAGARPAPQRPRGPDPDKVHTIPSGKSPIKGPEDASVTIVEFSDYQCPFCARSEPLIAQALEAYPTQARFVFKHFPLTSIHPHAMGASKAAVAAQKQGKFWEMHELLFANQRALSPEQLQGYAQQIGLDMEQFKADMESAEVENLVKEDMRLAQQVGVRGTPTIFVNGKILQNRSLDGFKQLIGPALKEKASG